MSNRSINIEVSTLRMILKRNKLWNHIVDDVHMLPEREDVGKALEREEAARLLKACFKSKQPSLYPAIVTYCNTGMRSAGLRRARWRNAKPTDFIFPSEKLAFKGKGSAKRGVMTPYELDLSKPIGPWKRAWTTAKKRAGG